MLQDWAAPLAAENSNPAWLNKYFWSNANDQLGRITQQEYAARETVVAEQVKEEQLNTAFDSLQIQAQGSQTFNTTVIQLSTQRGISRVAARELLLGAILERVEAGIEDPEAYVEKMLGGQTITLEDGTEIPLSEALRNDPTYIKLMDRARRKNEDNRRLEDAEQLRQVEDLIDRTLRGTILEDGTYDLSEREALLDDFDRRFENGEISSSVYLDAKRTINNTWSAANEQEIAAVKRDLDAKRNSLNLDPEEIIDAANKGFITVQERDNYLQAAAEQEDARLGLSGSVSRDEVVDDIFLPELKMRVSITDNSAVGHYSVELAAQYAGDLYVAKFTAYREQGMSVTQAAEKARNEVLTMIGKAGTDKDSAVDGNPFNVLDHTDSRVQKGALFPHFTAGLAPTSDITTVQLTEYGERFRSNPEYVSNTLVLGEDRMLAIKEDMESGRRVRIPPVVYALAKRSGLTVEEILAGQYEAYFGEKVEFTPGGYSAVVQSVEADPAVTQYLQSQPSLARANTAIAVGGNSPAVIRKGVDGEQDVMATARAAQFISPELAAAVWALETGRGESQSHPNGLFNIKSRDGTGPVTQTREFINGQWVTQEAQWAQYNSPLEACKPLHSGWIVRVLVALLLLVSLFR